MPGKWYRIFEIRNGSSNKPQRMAGYRPLGNITSEISIKNDELYLAGIQIDTLADTIPSRGLDYDSARTNARNISRIRDRDMNYTYFTGESYHEALKRTMAMDLIYEDFLRPSKRGGEVELTLLSIPRAELSLEEYRRQLNMRTAQNRAFSLRHLGLSSERYLLMVPSNAVVGDGFWALPRGQALHILRPVE